MIATATASAGNTPKSSRVLLAEEAAGRDQATIRTRRRASGLPAGKTFDAWEPERSVIPAADPAGATDAGMDRPRTRCCASAARPGPARATSIEALGHLAIDKGKTVAWHTPETLAQLLRRHRVDDSVNKAIGKLIRVDLVVIDDVGLLPISTDAAEALFRVVDAAYEKRSIAISLEHPPVRVRRADAQEPRHRDRRPATAPRARPDHRRAGQLPARPSDRRQGGATTDLNTTANKRNLLVGRFVATSGEKRWPPVGKFVAASGEKLDGH